jgi:hypothetical protein
VKLGLEAIVPAVFTSALNLRERALSVQETWLKDFPNGYLIGGYHFDPDLRMIALGKDVGEDYHSAHRKQFLGLLELRERHPEARWFYITGCDAFIFSDNLAALLSRFDPSKPVLVGGHCGQVTIDGEPFLFPSGGPGFAASGTLLDILKPAIPSFIQEWELGQPALRSACDVAFAWLSRREAGVGLTYAEGFYYGPPYYYPNNTFKDGTGRDVNQDVIDRPIAFHNLSIREMYLLSRGIWPKRPGLAAKVYDKAAYILSRRLKTKRIVNAISRILFG